MPQSGIVRGVFSSPGVLLSRAGNISSDTWLLAGQTSSNITGHTIPYEDSQIAVITVSCQENSTFDLEIYEHDKITYTLLTTISLLNEITKNEYFEDLILTTGKELAAKVATGSTKNINVQILVRGR